MQWELQPTTHPWIKRAGRHLWVHRFPSSATDQEVREFVAANLKLHATMPRPYALLSDLRSVRYAPAKHRRMIADMLRETAEMDALHSLGVAILVDGPLRRGLVTAVLWLSPATFAFEIHTNEDRALSYLESRLRGANVLRAATPYPQ